MAVNAQDLERFTVIENKLKELSKDNIGLNNKVELSVNGVSIQEFIRGIGTANNLNVSIDNGLNSKIVNNFTNVTVADVLLFLCKKYDLDISFVGNIMSIKQYEAPAKPSEKYQSKKINVSYDKAADLLTLDFNNDSLSLVAKELTKVSQKNVVFAPDLTGKLVSGYIQQMPFNAAMEKFAFANSFKVTPTDDNFYLLEKLDAGTDNNNTKGKSKGKVPANSPGLNVEVGVDKLVTVEANDVAISDILNAVSSEMKNNYFLFTVPKGNTSLNIKNATYDQFLNRLFNNTDFTFKKDGEIYLIGDRNIEGLRLTKLFQLKYRTVDKVIDVIPSELKKNVDVKAFNDQNSLILSGSQPRIEEIEAFLRDIDRVVPVISIEVIIMDISNFHNVSTGIKATLGDGGANQPSKTSGQVFPGVNIAATSTSINNVITGINGLGIVNLGKVTPNFYVTLQLMEDNGDLKINSTPLLATLNGHEAKMNISETRYYLQQTTNVTSNNSTNVANSQQYIPLNAEFSLTIHPIVSGDEQITLDINVKKQSFTTQYGINGTGPFGTSTRDFQSLIRIKNQEMIMLGGLDEENKSQTGSGVPILSRIPVLKWFFGLRTKKVSKSKLTIFIKPTVIY